MPRIQCERIDPKWDGGPGLWRGTILYDADEEIAVFGESLWRVVEKLSKQLKGREQMETRERAMGWRAEE